MSYVMTKKNNILSNQNQFLKAIAAYASMSMIDVKFKESLDVIIVKELKKQKKNFSEAFDIALPENMIEHNEYVEYGLSQVDINNSTLIKKVISFYMSIGGE